MQQHQQTPPRDQRTRSATTAGTTRPSAAYLAAAEAASANPPRSSLGFDAPRSPGHHVSYDFAREAGAVAGSPQLPPPAMPAHSRSDTDIPRDDSAPYSPGGGVPSPTATAFGLAGLRRRSSRAPTFRTFDGGDEYDLPFSSRLGWQPGAEPGYDPKLPDGGHASVPALSAECEVTVVDYSLDRMQQWHFDNDGFVEFMGRSPKAEWAQCRWINVNGLSWDVIQAVGSAKGLHKLAIEDIMNLRNRTKVDWYADLQRRMCVSALLTLQHRYPNHAFMIMTLQKLVHVVDGDESGSDSDDDDDGSNKGRKALQQFFSSSLGTSAHDPEKMEGVDAAPPFSDLKETTMPRTLQRYQASGNEARTQFMEAHSSLAPYNMAISAEQVSIFLTSDNTVVSFFEASADDIERPIVKRLSTPGTILRDSCDASLLMQGIIDAIIDLAIPLTAAYTDILGDLELDVISSPSIKQSKRLYICISEINKMLRFLLPVDNLVNVLRDHRTFLTQEQAARELTNPASGVIVTPMTHTYLGDVLDHSIILTESLQQLKQSSENLINLIFNTITANQNESMKQLTTVTIIFLPLTFITGFFGQNFEGFPEIKNGIWYL